MNDPSVNRNYFGTTEEQAMTEKRLGQHPLLKKRISYTEKIGDEITTEGVVLDISDTHIWLGEHQWTDDIHIFRRCDIKINYKC